MNKLTALLPVALLITACGGDKPNTGPDATAPSEPVEVNEAIQAVFAQTLPEGDAISLPDLRQAAKAGDDVIVEGRIMGVLKPFVENRAVFILGDNGVITPCNEMANDDHCKTPWDACCDPSETKLNGTATIQIVDAGGSVIRQGLKGVNDLDIFSSVRIAGTLAPNAGPDTLIINADAIQVTRP